MIFNLRDKAPRYIRLQSWRSWFAWRPVKIAPQLYCWLQRVERRRVSEEYNVMGYFGVTHKEWRWKWEYRLHGS